jgi:hypothetical protein
MPAPRRRAMARPSFVTLGLWYGLCFGPSWLKVVSPRDGGLIHEGLHMLRGPSAPGTAAR